MASGKRLRVHASVSRYVSLCFCLALILSGCAQRTQPDMDVNGTSDESGQSDRMQQGRAGGGLSGGSIWPEIARTALQTGMGFLHH
ncbi:hypothetical protein HW511_08050 [Asaia siamensis]|nr:hypothetical protein [Asaia siamensis]